MNLSKKNKKKKTKKFSKITRLVETEPSVSSEQVELAQCKWKKCIYQNLEMATLFDTLKVLVSFLDNPSEKVISECNKTNM